MRIVVMGAAGRSGREVVGAALSRGYEVVAVARRPQTISVSDPLLTVLAGDALDQGTWEAATRGADAVISALGPHGGRAPTTVYSEGASLALEAMRINGVSRIVMVSAVPVGVPPRAALLTRALINPMLYAFFGGVYADMKRMEGILAASDADWTVMRPPMLTEAAARGQYRAVARGPLARASRISRGDLGIALVDALDRPEWVRAVVTVAD